MNRAEMRRQKKQQSKMEEALKKAGVPEFQMPAAPMRVNGLSDRELADMTGLKVVALENWRKEQTELIQKAAVIEAQEKLDRAEEYITFCNILTSLKALDGFRYAKAAINHLLEHYNKSITDTEKGNAKQTYEELHKKYGIEFEFDEPNLNEELGFGDVDWMNEYIGRNIPYSVYNKIYNDAKNIQSVYTQLAVIWELCEEFGFSRHKKGDGSMLEKFMIGTKKKYDYIDALEHGASDIAKMLKKRYDIEIGWEDGTQDTIERFDL